MKQLNLFGSRSTKTAKRKPAKKVSVKKAAPKKAAAKKTLCGMKTISPTALKKELKDKGYKLPHGYTIAKRKPAKKAPVKKAATKRATAKRNTKRK